MSTLLGAHQTELLSRLRTSGKVLRHPSAKGGSAELDWIGMLSDFLPSRYRVSKAFAVDSAGALSNEIDVVVHDRHYSPLLFHHGGATYVPAESVYAVFEVKSSLRREHVSYASQKAASVRRLNRTSVAITHAGGKYPPRKPFRIPAGLLATDAAWKGDLEPVLRMELDGRPPEERLQLGCVASRAGFEVLYSGGRVTRIETSPRDLSASFFMLRLLAQLQGLATVPALNFSQYLREAMTGHH